MLRNIVLFGIILLFAGCSSSVVQKETGTAEKKGDARFSSKAAMDHFIEGSVAEMKGDYASAILEYQEVLSIDPNAGVYYALGKNYMQLNKLPQALNHARQAVALEPANSEYNKLLAEIYVNANYPDSAETVYARIISNDSSDSDALYNLAFLYERSKPMQAVGIYKKLIDVVGPEWNILVRMAELYERLGKLEESIATLENLLEIDPSNTELQKLLTEQYIKASKFDQAMKNADELSRLFPEDLSLKELRAQIFMAKDDWKSASKEYEELMNSNGIPFEAKMRIGSAYLNRSLQDSTILPVAQKMFILLDRDTTAWQVKMVLGEIAMQLKDDSSAQHYLKQVTELAGWNADAFVRLGGLYFDNKRYSDAVSLLGGAADNFPDNFVINLILGLSYSQMNNFSGAEPYLKKAVELNSRDITALSAYGFSLNQLKKTDESVKYIKKALEIAPDNVDLLGTLGLIYNAQKKWAQCDSAYVRALELDSSNTLVLNNYAYSLAERGIKLNEALEMVQRAVSEDPMNSSYLDTIGWVYYRLGDFKLAESYISKAIDLDTSNATLLEHMGDIAFKMGNRQRAIELWQKSYQMDSSNGELKQKIEKGEL